MRLHLFAIPKNALVIGLGNGLMPFSKDEDQWQSDQRMFDNQRVESIYQLPNGNRVGLLRH